MRVVSGSVVQLTQMFTLSLNDITEAIGNVVDGTETGFMSLNSLDKGADVVLEIPDPLTKAVGTTIYPRWRT